MYAQINMHCDCYLCKGLIKKQYNSAMQNNSIISVNSVSSQDKLTSQEVV